MAYLSKFGLVIPKELLTESEIQLLKNELTAIPLCDTKYGYKGSLNYPVYTDTKNKLYIPKMYGLKYCKEKGIVLKYTKAYIGKEWVDPIEFRGTLFENQIEPVNLMINTCKEIGGGILSLNTGQGKSISALKIISELKGKTLIIVNKITLLKQWEQEIISFLPDARIGFLQGSKNISLENTDIVIAMLQSLSKIDYPSEFFEDIMILIIDEIHNISSKSFSKVLFKTCSKYTIGLTATPNRSDGCENVFKWHIGEIV